MTRLAVSATLSLVLLSACTRPGDVATARTALVDADRAFNKATAERRTDGWMEFFAEDGLMIRSAGTITGKPAIHDEMAKAFADTAFTLTWEPDQADASGDVGYTNAHFRARFRDDKGKEAVRTGRD